MKKIRLAVIAITVTFSAHAKPVTLYEDTDTGRKLTVGGVAVYDIGYATDSPRIRKDVRGDSRFLRMDFQGKLSDNWSFRYLNEFANDVMQTRDAWIAYDGIENTRIMAGQFIEYNSITEQSAPFNQHFLERPVSITSLQALRNIGLGATHWESNYGVQAGIFGASTGRAGDLDSGWGTTLRGYYFPIYNPEEHKVLHLGASYRYRQPDGHPLRYGARGEEGGLFPPVVGTGSMTSVDSHQTYTLETYATHGSLAFLATTRRARVDRHNVANPSFWGANIQLSYMLTPDQRPYNPQMGAWGGVSPHSPLDEGGYGAWELALRFDRLDMDDAGIAGGVYDSATVGVNWFPTAETRVSANYIANKIDGAAGATAPDYLVGRLQFVF